MAAVRRVAGRSGWLDLVAATPLLSIPVLAYNLACARRNPEDADLRLGDVLFDMAMASGGRWAIGLGDLLVLIALVCLFIELLKSTASRRTVIVNHALSMVLFIVCLVEFLLLPAFATSTFFLIMAMSLLDAIADVLPDIEKVGELRRVRSGWLNGVKEFPVRYGAASAGLTGEGCPVAH